MTAPTMMRRRGRKPATTRYVDAQALYEHYQRFFEASIATTPALLKAAQHLRYQVFCEERLLLPARDYPDQIETDAFDSHAHHAVLTYRPDNRMIATMRLIMPNHDKPLPTFALCPKLQDDVVADKTAELSRLVVSKEFRRRWNDGDYGAVSPWLAGDNQRRIPHTSLGLLRLMLQQARSNGITHVAALTEPAMLRMLEGLGFYFAPVGPLVDCAGLRQPCYAKLDSLLYRLKRERPEIWYYVTDAGQLG